jgi:hypothetical protein
MFKSERGEFRRVYGDSGPHYLELNEGIEVNIRPVWERLLKMFRARISRSDAPSTVPGCCVLIKRLDSWRLWTGVM